MYGRASLSLTRCVLGEGVLRGLARRLLGVPAAQADGHQTRLARRTPPCAVLQWPVCCSVIAQPKSSVRVDFAWQDEGFGVGRTVQHMHDFVVTMPGAYHTGFNCGHARSLARSLLAHSLIYRS